MMCSVAWLILATIWIAEGSVLNGSEPDLNSTEYLGYLGFLVPELQTIIAIKDRRNEFTTSFPGSNPADIYTKNATMIPPGMHPLLGREKIREYYQNDLNDGVTSVEMKHFVLDVHGDVAYEAGDYELNGARGPESGSYLLVWYKYDGVWYIQADCFNIINAAPPLSTESPVP